jgi:hypothetical protein
MDAKARLAERYKLSAPFPPWLPWLQGADVALHGFYAILYAHEKTGEPSVALNSLLSTA